MPRRKSSNTSPEPPAKKGPVWATPCRPCAGRMVKNPGHVCRGQGEKSAKCSHCVAGHHKCEDVRGPFSSRHAAVVYLAETLGPLPLDVMSFAYNILLLNTSCTLVAGRQRWQNQARRARRCGGIPQSVPGRGGSRLRRLGYQVQPARASRSKAEGAVGGRVHVCGCCSCCGREHGGSGRADTSAERDPAGYTG